MERRKKRSKKEWEKLVSKHEHSGLSARSFCLARSIGLGSFYEWRRRFRNGMPEGTGEEKPSEPFIDLGRMDASGGSMTTGLNSLIVTLDLGNGAKLTVQRR